jgi:hypothetical protein
MKKGGVGFGLKSDIMILDRRRFRFTTSLMLSLFIRNIMYLSRMLLHVAASTTPVHRLCKCIFIPTMNKTIFSCSFT